MRAHLQDIVKDGGHEGYRHIVSLSGGKDSAALAVFLRHEFPELQTEYVFCDTQCELPETYAYLDMLEDMLGKEIVRISAFDLLKVRDRHNRNPFDIVLNEVYSGFLPSPNTRWCTRLLKIQVFENYIGESKAYNYIGIRADENREGFRPKKPPVISEAPNIIPVYPFLDYNKSYQDIMALLDDSGVGIPSYYEWRTRSGCYFCFYQQVGEWQGLKEKHPELFIKAQSYESPERGYTWCEGKSLEDIASQEKRELVRPNENGGCVICHL
jgi:3'-phosphoadenosine 5'-phosphosulfate sulfotransferase (PAPS reductase)/FAD synthetase